MVARGLKEEPHAHTTGQAGEADEQTSGEVTAAIGIRDRLVSFKLVNQDDAND